MRLRKKQGSSEIPTSSMADIAFLLIIFFMVTTVFSATKGLEMALPEDEKGPTDPEPAVLVHVLADSTYRVDCRSMELGEILDYLEPKLTRNPAKPVVIYTQADAPYQAMVSAYDELVSASVETHGFEVRNISVPTQSEVAEYISTFGLDPFQSHCED